MGKYLLRFAQDRPIRLTGQNPPQHLPAKAQIGIPFASAISGLENRILNGPTLQSAVSEALRNGGEAPYEATASLQTGVPAAGEVEFSIVGNVYVDGDEWVLYAEVYPSSEPYDMNPKPWGERRLPAEAATRMSDAANFKEFEAQYVGGFEIEARGRVLGCRPMQDTMGQTCNY